MPSKFILSKEKEREAKRLYKEGMSLEKVAKMFNCTRPTIRKFLVEHDVTIRNNNIGKKKNDNYFSYIDSEEKAYWLGFLYADGSVSKTQNRTSLKLKREDKQHIIKFKKSIEGTMSIYDGVDKSYDVPYSQIQIYSSQIKRDLIKWGCVPNKTKKLAYPNFLNEKLINHFIRGYFDGDGSLFKTNKGQWEASFIGTISFIEELKGVLNLKTKIIYLNNKINASLRMYKDVEYIMDFLYKDANIYLDRKYKRYLKMKKDMA